jgi:hypothetical protein
MIRVFLLELFVFLLPFLVYALVVTGGGRKPDDIWAKLPALTLFATAAALILIVMLSFVSFQSEPARDLRKAPSISAGKNQAGKVE